MIPFTAYMYIGKEISFPTAFDETQAAVVLAMAPKSSSLFLNGGNVSLFFDYS